MSLVNLAHVCSHLQNVTRANMTLTSIPMTKLHLQVALGLYKEGFLTSIQRGSLKGPDAEFIPTTYDNISTRRLWLGLKYYNSRPVLRSLHLVSHPNRRLHFTPTQIHEFLSGKTIHKVKPLQLGEVMFIRVPGEEVVEIQEAAKRNVGGEILCRAN